ncbi:HAD family hydrolase [Microvirga brassicacearum]|nr:HAD-IA family hydrolase [Microvirga brassicacearum]
MMKTKVVSGKKLTVPRALLLDFGGVIVETSRVPGWEARLARHIHELLADLKPAVDSHDVEQIASDIKAGCTADSHWKNAMSRPFAPRELRQEEFWGDFVAADWPQKSRDAVVQQASDLCRRMGNMRSTRALRDGILDLLDIAEAAGVQLGIVSNALSGQVHLDFLQERGLTSRFAVEIHSDAAGVRKPNPEMILLAVRRLGLVPSEAWYVGDNFDRDVLCGKRAGIGGNILMEAEGTYHMPYDLKVAPDAIIAGPRELIQLFQNAQRGKAA